MKRVLLWSLAVLLVLTLWVLWANTAVEINEWKVQSPDIPDAFDGLRIAQISDLHNTEFGQKNRRLLALLRRAEPDIIVLTGDLIDSRNTRVEVALDFAARAVEIAPCYYVSGNHENRILQWYQLRQGLLDAGVTVLEDAFVTLEQDGDAMLLAGLQDPDFHGDFDGTLDRLAAREEYTILLCHRPERFEQYVEAGVDLVFAGHAHGGQARLPFVGGLVAPHQGWFPEYDAGLFREGETVMLVSRGVGNSLIPLRFNNRPEILVAVLDSGGSI